MTTLETLDTKTTNSTSPTPMVDGPGWSRSRSRGLRRPSLPVRTTGVLRRRPLIGSHMSEWSSNRFNL